MHIYQTGHLSESQRLELALRIRQMTEENNANAAQEGKVESDDKSEHRDGAQCRQADGAGSCNRDERGREGPQKARPNTQGRSVGAYRHLHDDGRVQSIPDPFISAQMEQAAIPPAEVSLDRIARRIGRIEQVLMVLVTVLERDGCSAPAAMRRLEGRP